MRLTNCTFAISSEKKAIGMFWSTAMFFAMLSAKAVLPIAGRAARITRSEFCQPEVILSNSWKPLAMPLRPSPCEAAFCSMS